MPAGKASREPLAQDDVVIRVQNVSKKFCRSLKRSMFYGMTDSARGMLGVSRDPNRLRQGEFWALKDVNFELRRGEALGLIGANGSGKSTLLRLLSGIFPPDEGRIEVKGRLGSLIAVGAGFHPHMSGRENIYLNGILLGMGRKEIAGKFDEMAAFAEIGDFLDAPVSTYSSGMRVRLGFSIAVHIEPDVLLVDEVMSVGDTAFRRRASQKMDELLTDRNVTLVLVSHNSNLIREHCPRCLLLEHGNIRYHGETTGAFDIYEQWDEEQGVPLSRGADAPIRHVRIFSEAGEGVIESNREFHVEFDYPNADPSRLLPVFIFFRNTDNVRVATYVTQPENVGLKESRNAFRLLGAPLAHGHYWVEVKIGSAYRGAHSSKGHPVYVQGLATNNGSAVVQSMFPET